MKKRHKKIWGWLSAIIIAVVVIACFAARVDLDAIDGRRYDVIDGDTIWVEDLGKIRYIGIDTPEIDEPYFKESTEYNELILKKGKIELEYDVELRDKYDRLLAYIFVVTEDGEEIFVNYELVRNGYATKLDIPPNSKYRARLHQGENDAKEEHLGIWTNK